ncbi:hypothetical protein RM543_11650 [Roseicyclus sp. F158]|uniref:H+/citrate symporter n=1 Tax=Tropicimonas omnivorans TaxID=3075590 RepID=A0ABU3DI15_9RHOB|nr:hypothetical protein [Roseicyclus sp. F158]MDT0683343.1 hypothetical protein [Roseicyclus sp. F158]
MQGRPAQAVAGVLLVATTILVICHEWSGLAVFALPAAVTTFGAIALLALRVAWSRRLYLLIGGALFAVVAAVLPGWRDAAAAAFGTASFIAAFFTALMTIRSVAAGSPSIQACGMFLAQQPPGRRYLALTIGGHLFGLILSYGAISLLGSLAASSVAKEPDPEIRAHRKRRMLVAIQRGFVSTLPWSPLAFAVAISTTLVPGASWSGAVLPCLVSALILSGTGWALDTIFKPRLTVPRPATRAEGGWLKAMAPLLILLAILLGCVTAIWAVAELRIIAAVMSVVPIIALVWAGIQGQGEEGALRHVGTRAAAFAVRDLPGNGPELVLLVMAGFIGTIGGQLAAAVVPGTGFDLAALPTWSVLLILFWLIPVAGQIGMNPILAVSLMAPLLPTPEALGVAPSTVIVAITGGWALSGSTSPFTASTLLIGSLGGVSATHVGLRWNSLYALTCGFVLSLWVLLLAILS